MASSSASSKPPADDKTLDDIDRLLNREASAFQREREVERILGAFKLNPYDVLDLELGVNADGIKRKYRQISLFIHPDKCPHPRAPEAFDILKKAESELSDEKKREEIDAVLKHARGTLLRSHDIPTTATDDDPKIASLTPPFKVQFRTKCKEMLIEEELRRRKAIKMNLANEGLEARKKEEEVETRKRKAEDDKAWEDNRETRVSSWRDFSKSSKKKKTKKGAQLLG